MCIVVLVVLLPGQCLGGLKKASGWEELELESTVIDDAQVYYEASLAPAREQAVARTVQGLAREGSPAHRMAANVLAIDPNQPNTYNRAP